jgi:hypothetical protein
MLFAGVRGCSTDRLSPQSLGAILTSLKTASACISTISLLGFAFVEYLPEDYDSTRRGRTMLFRELCTALVAAADARFTSKPMLHDRLAELLDSFIHKRSQR